MTPAIRTGMPTHKDLPDSDGSVVENYQELPQSAEPARADRDDGTVETRHRNLPVLAAGRFDSEPILANAEKRVINLP